MGAFSTLYGSRSTRSDFITAPAIGQGTRNDVPMKTARCPYRSLCVTSVKSVQVLYRRHDRSGAVRLDAEQVEVPSGFPTGQQ